MSAVSPQLTGEASAYLGKARSPMAQLLHALNQPLTGLQCSLELALALPRSVEQYAHTLRAGLGLTERMRVLSEAMRELTDAEQDGPEPAVKFRLEPLLQEIVNELRPLAEDKGVRILCEGTPQPMVYAGRRSLGATLLRLLDSGLSLAAGGSVLQVVSALAQEEVCLCVRWQPAAEAPEYSPFSRPELGLLIASATALRAGAECLEERTDVLRGLTIRVPASSALDILPSR